MCVRVCLSDVSVWVYMRAHARLCVCVRACESRCHYLPLTRENTDTYLGHKAPAPAITFDAWIPYLAMWHPPSLFNTRNADIQLGHKIPVTTFDTEKTQPPLHVEHSEYTPYCWHFVRKKKKTTSHAYNTALFLSSVYYGINLFCFNPVRSLELLKNLSLSLSHLLILSFSITPSLPPSTLSLSLPLSLSLSLPHPSTLPRVAITLDRVCRKNYTKSHYHERLLRNRPVLSTYHH